MERKEIPHIDPDVELGLSAEQVRTLREAGWENRVSGSGLPDEKTIIARHCFTFFNLIFAVLAVILLLVGSGVTNFGFLGVVVINLAIGIVQEIRAKRALEKLTLVARQTLKTVRDGKFVEVPDDRLVLGDIVCFAGGAQVCADAVVRSGQLLVNESLITGEPDAIEKNEGDELMAGSFVVAGNARVQLIRVGDDSYAAKLSREAKQNPRAGTSKMMEELEKLVRLLAALLVPVGILYFLTAVAGDAADKKTAAEQTVAALVSLIPQGLYLLTSVALAVSSIKLSRSRVLARDMSCIETLARTDVLCVDKTGTITEPGLQLEEVIPLDCGAEYVQGVLGALYGAVPAENETARAVKELFPDSGWVCKKRIPFTSDRKWSGGEFDRGAFLAGAPEYILASRYSELEAQVRPWNEKGCRVLLAARYEGALTETINEEFVTPLALLVLTGRIRDSAPETFRFFADQGVTVKVISGDNPVTVSDIARRAGIPGAESYVDCSALKTPEALEAAAEGCTVFGRVTPEQKRALVKALQAKGHTVAMTGDGVNDVLAMRQADCSVAMAGGAQAASQVAQLVLVGSDFAGMPRIVDEGRRVVGNIRRAAALFLVKNIFTLAMVLTAMLSPLVYPFQPVHLTVVMALTVGIPSFFFALEPNRERIKGEFLKGALWQALPAGLAGFCAVVIAQLAANALGLTATQLSTVCAAALGTVGLLVLLTVCRPMTPLRWGVVLSVTVLLVGAFLLPTGLLGLDVYHGKTALLILGVVLCAAALLALFTWLAKKIKKDR